MSNISKTINYIELPLVDLEATKTFYGDALGWEFQEWGPTYISFSGAGIDGGFNGESGLPVTKPGILLVLYADDLEKIERQIVEAGGKIITPAYGFPGGRRFHFHDPNGNELAVWSET